MAPRAGLEAAALRLTAVRLDMEPAFDAGIEVTCNPMLTRLWRGGEEIFSWPGVTHHLRILLMEGWQDQPSYRRSRRGRASTNAHVGVFYELAQIGAAAFAAPLAEGGVDDGGAGHRARDLYTSPYRDVIRPRSSSTLPGG